MGFRVKNSTFKYIKSLAFVVAFASVGVFIKFAARASAPSANIEPELQSVTTPAAVVSDATASNGKAVQFNSPPPQPLLRPDSRGFQGATRLRQSLSEALPEPVHCLA